MGNSKYLLSLDDIADGSRICIYGAGGGGRTILKLLKRRKGISVTSFADSQKTGALDELPVWSPQELSDKRNDVDLIVIASATGAEAIEGMLHNMQIHNYLVATLDAVTLKDSFFLKDDISTHLWLAKEILFGRITSPRLLKALFWLRRLGDGGYYHNVRLTKRYSTHSVGGVRKNCPLSAPDYSEVLWKMTAHELSMDIRGKKVVDIGPADGWFTIESAREGAKVTYIHPPHAFVHRISALADYFGVRNRIKAIIGLFPADGKDAVFSSDLIYCLGLLYHLENVKEGVEALIESRKPLVIEGEFYCEDAEVDSNGYVKTFNPIEHREGPLCAKWLTDLLENNQYKVQWLDEWQKFVEEPGNLRYQQIVDGPEKFRHRLTRRALIARPL